MTILSLMVLSLPGALASRTEGATMLQVSQLLERTSVGRDNQLAGMKDQILAFADTGVPAAAVPLLNTIKSTLSGSILEAIQNETNAATTLDGTLRQAFTDASTTFTNAKDAQNTARDTTVPNRRSAHITCRNDQKDLNTTHNTCVGQLGTARSEYATSHGSATSAFQAVTTGSAADADSDSACVNGITWRSQPDGSLDAMSTAVDTYKNAIDDLKSKRTTFNNKLTECGYSDSGNKADNFKVSAVTSPTWTGALKNVHDKIATCNTAQTDYQNDACALSRALDTANSDYDTAYNSAKDAYTGQSTVWQGETANRFHQCQLVHTLICYVEALIAKDEKSALQTEVGKCDVVAADYDATNKADRAYNADCSKYEFAAGAMPTRDTDATVPASPCGSGWDLGVNHGTIAPNAACTACNPAIGAAPVVIAPVMTGAALSSQYPNGGQPQKCIDGNQNQKWGSGSCCHTNLQQDGSSIWLRIELEQLSTVSKVDVWGRTDRMTSDQSNHLDVILTETLDEPTDPLASQICAEDQSFTSDGRTTVTCAAPTLAKYVWLWRRSDATASAGNPDNRDPFWIVLCEVEVA